MSEDLPVATIRFLAALGKSAKDSEPIDGRDAIDLMQRVMREARRIRSEGGSILWVDFTLGGTSRRRYVDGRKKNLDRLDNKRVIRQAGESSNDQQEKKG